MGKSLKLSELEKRDLWTDNYSRYVQVSKKSFSALRKANNAQKGTKDYEEELKLRKNIVYEYIKPQFKQLEAEKNYLANEYEFQYKHSELREQFEEGIFYLCSSHINPAKDHAEWEGKIYVHEDWEERVGDNPDLASRIRAYIKNHKIKTVQWVTGEPVWLCTRPNCAHFLKEVSIDEVLNNGVKSLLKKHNMYHKDVKQLSYEEIQYKKYYERLKMLSYLSYMFDSEKLNKDISKTKKIIKSWKLKMS